MPYKDIKKRRESYKKHYASHRVEIQSKRRLKREEDPKKHKSYMENWKQKNHEQVKQLARDWHKKKRELLAGSSRPDRCEVCGGLGKICFDHNHETGKFRGWICKRCNTVLGYVEDSVELLEALVKYLKK